MKAPAADAHPGQGPEASSVQQVRPGSGPSLKGRALRYLSQREHSRAELERKLARFVEDTPEQPAAGRIAQVLDELAAHGLLSEQRAAEALVAAKSARFGARRLQQTLRQRGVDPEAAAAALAGVEASEAERARAVWQRRFGVPAEDPADRARQARFLAGRGFGAELIRRIVRGLDDEPA